MSVSGNLSLIHKEHKYIRVYTGLEDAAYLIKDLEGALGKI